MGACQPLLIFTSSGKVNGGIWSFVVGVGWLGFAGRRESVLRMTRMDAKRHDLEEKLQESLRQAAAIATQLQALDQGEGTPHFDQIEMPAHEVGQQLSQLVQTTRARELAADALQDVPCPTCGKRCSVETSNRKVHSIDGHIDLMETVAHCSRCRRSFFPLSVKRWDSMRGSQLQASSDRSRFSTGKHDP